MTLLQPVEPHNSWQMMGRKLEERDEVHNESEQIQGQGMNMLQDVQQRDHNASNATASAPVVQLHFVVPAVMSIL